MKNCPICASRCFDDMDVCYGCMYRFDRNVSDPLIPPEPTAPSTSNTVDGSPAQQIAAPLSGAYRAASGSSPTAVSLHQGGSPAQLHVADEEFGSEGILFEPAPASVPALDPSSGPDSLALDGMRVLKPDIQEENSRDQIGFHAALPVNADVLKTEYQLVISFQPCNKARLVPRD